MKGRGEEEKIKEKRADEGSGARVSIQRSIETRPDSRKKCSRPIVIPLVARM